MTREEAYRYAMRACEETWNEKTCKQIKEALEQEPCDDVVSRQEVLEKAINVPIAKVVTEDKVIYRKIVFADDIENLPPVTPKQRTGHWIFDEILDKHYYCSECKYMGVDYWDYCPNCGCRMVEPQESEVKG